MEHQKIINLLDNTPNQWSKFRTKNWVEINDDPNFFGSLDIKYVNLFLSEYLLYLLISRRNMHKHLISLSSL